MADIVIGGRLHSAATGNTVAGANEIMDDAQGKKQSVVNQETNERFNAYDTAILGRYTNEEINNLISNTPETDVIVVDIPAASQSDIAGWLDANTPSGTDPETGKSVRANKLYRVPGPDNHSYSEWGWDGTAYKMLANKDYGIDERPTKNSNNIAKSGGVFDGTSLAFTGTVNAGTLTIACVNGYLTFNYDGLPYVYVNGRNQRLESDSYVFQVREGGIVYYILLDGNNLICTENQLRTIALPVVAVICINRDASDIFEIIYCQSRYIYKGKTYNTTWGVNGLLNSKKFFANNVTIGVNGGVPKIFISENVLHFKVGAQSNVYCDYGTTNLAVQDVTFNLDGTFKMVHVIAPYTFPTTVLLIDGGNTAASYDIDIANQYIYIGYVIVTPMNTIFDVNFNGRYILNEKNIDTRVNNNDVQNLNNLNNLNNYCFARTDSDASFSVLGNTATFSTGASQGLTLLYKNRQTIALAANQTKTFEVQRNGVLYNLCYDIDLSEIVVYKFDEIAGKNVAIIGGFITSPSFYTNGLYDYIGFVNINIDGQKSGGNKVIDENIKASVSSFSELSIASIIPIVKGNRLEIFRKSITTEPENIYDLQALTDNYDAYNQGRGRFRQNGYIFDAKPESGEFDITFRLIDYNAKNVKSSVASHIVPIDKKTSPITEKKVLVIGDSYTWINTWLTELSRRLKGTGGTPTADGLSNITFIGTQTTSANKIPSEGWSGKDYTFFVGNESPFYKNGSIDIGQYVSDNSFGSIDYVIILLGANGNNPESDIRTLLDSFIAYNPNIKILVGSNSMKYSQDGWETSHGLQAGMRSSNWRNWYDWNNMMKSLIENHYEDNALYVEIPGQVDIENNFSYELGPANNRNSTIQVRYGKDNVHPSDSAYYQIADAFYNAFHYWFLN